MRIHRMFHRFMEEAAADGAAGGHSAAPAGQQGNADADAPDEAAIAATAAVEAEASKMGWTSKADFKGDPARWRDASEFVERGKNMVPILQATSRKQATQIEELTRTVKDFANHMTKTEQRGYDRALADLKEQRKAAVAAGDGETFDKVDDAIADLRKEAEGKAAKAAKADDADDPVFNEWAGRNKWLEDPKMEAFGNSAADYLRKTGEKSTGAEFLELVAKEVKAKFPEKFVNPRREAAASVEGAAPAPRKGGKGYADLPADARAACDRMTKNGFSGNAEGAKQFKEQYVKSYYEEA